MHFHNFYGFIFVMFSPPPQEMLIRKVRRQSQWGCAERLYLEVRRFFFLWSSQQEDGASPAFGQAHPQPPTAVTEHQACLLLSLWTP